MATGLMDRSGAVPVGVAPQKDVLNRMGTTGLYNPYAQTGLSGNGFVQGATPTDMQNFVLNQANAGIADAAKVEATKGRGQEIANRLGLSTGGTPAPAIAPAEKPASTFDTTMASVNSLIQTMTDFATGKTPPPGLNIINDMATNQTQQVRGIFSGLAKANIETAREQAGIGGLAGSGVENAMVQSGLSQAEQGLQQSMAGIQQNQMSAALDLTRQALGFLPAAVSAQISVAGMQMDNERFEQTFGITKASYYQEEATMAWESDDFDGWLSNENSKRTAMGDKPLTPEEVASAQTRFNEYQTAANEAFPELKASYGAIIQPLIDSGATTADKAEQWYPALSAWLTLPDDKQANTPMPLPPGVTDEELLASGITIPGYEAPATVTPGAVDPDLDPNTGLGSYDNPTHYTATDIMADWSLAKYATPGSDLYNSLSAEAKVIDLNEGSTRDGLDTRTAIGVPGVGSIVKLGTGLFQVKSYGKVKLEDGTMSDNYGDQVVLQDQNGTLWTYTAGTPDQLFHSNSGGSAPLSMDKNGNIGVANSQGQIIDWNIVAGGK